MKKKRYHKCSECNKIATWLYMPSTKGKIFFCDDHVPRGCFCNSCHIEEDGKPLSDNVLWLDEAHTTYEYLDEKGRREPCCEYDYEENGQEFFEKTKMIKVGDILEIWDKLAFIAPNDQSVPSLLKYIDKIKNKNVEEIEYNPFMQKVRKLCTPYWRFIIFGKGKEIVHFYNSFREQCYQKKLYEIFG